MWDIILEYKNVFLSLITKIFDNLRLDLHNLKKKSKYFNLVNLVYKMLCFLLVKPDNFNLIKNRKILKLRDIIYLFLLNNIIFLKIFSGLHRILYLYFFQSFNSKLIYLHLF